MRRQRTRVQFPAPPPRGGERSRRALAVLVSGVFSGGRTPRPPAGRASPPCTPHPGASPRTPVRLGACSSSSPKIHLVAASTRGERSPFSFPGCFLGVEPPGPRQGGLRPLHPPPGASPRAPAVVALFE